MLAAKPTTVRQLNKGTRKGANTREETAIYDS